MNAFDSDTPNSRDTAAAPSMPPTTATTIQTENSTEMPATMAPQQFSDSPHQLRSPPKNISANTIASTMPQNTAPENGNRIQTNARVTRPSKSRKEFCGRVNWVIGTVMGWLSCW